MAYESSMTDIYYSHLMGVENWIKFNDLLQVIYQKMKKLYLNSDILFQKIFFNNTEDALFPTCPQEVNLQHFLSKE